MWGAAAPPSSPKRVHSSLPSRVHGSSAVGCRCYSSITKRVHQLPERMHQLRSGAPQLLRHHQARIQLSERARQLQYGVLQQLRHHQARTQLPRRFQFENADDNIERSRYGSRRWWQTTVGSEIVPSLGANSWRTASRLEMYSTTDYRERRVVVLTKDFPDAGRRTGFVRRRTSDEGSNRGLNR